MRRRTAALRELKRAVGPEDVSEDPLTLALYSRDASMFEGEAALIAFPKTVEQIAACVRIARDHGLSVVPRGSGTGLAGGATPVHDALVVIDRKSTV